jgi:general secretion pathway protein G
MFFRGLLDVFLQDSFSEARNKTNIPPLRPGTPGSGRDDKRKRSKILLVKSCRPNRHERGLTLIELIAAITILAILVGGAIPVARVRIKRERERELRRDLWEMRDAIDRYKDAADKGAFQTKVGSENYPPDLETLVKGVDVQGKTMRFLRRIPIDPMTGKTEWGLRSLQDDPDSTSWGEQNVFDVYTTSTDTALDGSKYSEW